MVNDEMAPWHNLSFTAGWELSRFSVTESQVTGNDQSRPILLATTLAQYFHRLLEPPLLFCKLRRLALAWALSLSVIERSVPFTCTDM